MARFLIVDDSVFLLKKIKAWLESEGHDVVDMGTNGIEGLELYQKYRPDVVTLDITMPMCDGCECLEEILKVNANAKVVMVSAIEDKSLILDCLSSGAKGYIEKPLNFSDDEFCEKFRGVLSLALDDGSSAS